MPVSSCHSKEEFEAALEKAGSNLVIVDFYTTWCGPCKRIAPQIAALSETEMKCCFLKVDAEECEELAKKYHVDAFPTFLLFKKGKKCSSVKGADLAKLKRKIAKYTA